MGKKKSNTFYGLTGERLQEYVELTYLNRTEIMALLKKFDAISNGMVTDNFDYRVPFIHIEEAFPQIKNNPFKDRICYVFSSKGDGYFSFEDLLDLCSAMSESCPNNVKAAWAFKLYDFDGDEEIGHTDALNIVERLTNFPGNGKTLDMHSKEKIVENLFKEMDLGFGVINALAFEHVIGKMAEFPASFSFRV